MEPFNRKHLTDLVRREGDQYRAANPRSLALHESAVHLFGGVPMTWMNQWVGGFPLGFSRAHGALLTDLDGHELVDFALGDTGAMAGHSPAALVRALDERVRHLGGVTTMMPTEDAEWVGHELTRRFGLAKWSFTLSATDANRWLLRLVHLVTQRPKILVFSYCYHGSVDETLPILDPRGHVTMRRPGDFAPGVDPTTTTRVVEFNDLEGLERELRHGDVAAVLTEPALTNIGIVLPEPGFFDGVRRLCDETATLLIVDETHTFSAGPGGATRRFGLRPDALTIGKSLGGGVPCGAYGLSQELADRIVARLSHGPGIPDVEGVGGTLAGNAMSLAAMRAVLGQVLTDDAFAAMEILCTQFAQGVSDAIATHGLAWSVSQLGARCEYRFTTPAPRTGGDSAAGADAQLEQYLHLYTVNRAILMTPFHNMALMCPATTSAQVALHRGVFDEALDELVG